ncbi:MAG: hypothetical protein K2X27_06070 [Candidatus Obscuribacterales bacterium]|nr:hypothetical protein [Candidatus Obscuribacterales bacterium]
MLKFKSYDAAEILGLTPLSRAAITDEMIFDLLLTPTVKALLGPLTAVGEPSLCDTTAGHFPGDESSNINAHVIEGRKDKVRHPYISVCHRTAYGAVVIKRDLRKLRVSAFVGDVDSGRAEPIYLVALRDRRYDGSMAANDCALLSFPYHDACNKPLSKELSSLEVSIYSFSPGSRIQDACGDLELDRFVEKPFTFLDRPQLFLKLFDKAWASKRAPGQHCAAIKDVAKQVLAGVETLAKLCGYDMLEAACSHYHVAMWFTSVSYRYSYKADLEKMTGIAQALKRIRDNGTPLTRSQQSWVCVLQSLPEELIPEKLRIGIKWPQDNISPESLWVMKPLSSRAQQLSLPLP